MRVAASVIFRVLLSPREHFGGSWCWPSAVRPIGTLGFKGSDYTIHNNEIGPVAQRLYDELTAIQWGEKPDPFGWIVPIPKN